ncbi:MAG: 3-phosphoshikimate 1-carboxyvinyltransferase [Anaerovoracaceae bacterium]
MNITIKPNRISGSIIVPPSKSYFHRVLIAAAFSNSSSKIAYCGKGEDLSEDILATINCLTEMGAEIEIRDNTIFVNPLKKKEVDELKLDFQESGTTARLLTPLAAIISEKFTAYGKGKLPERPFSELLDAMKKNGGQIELNNKIVNETNSWENNKVNSKKEMFTVYGKLKPGKYELPGNVSSQYISALLFTLPMLYGDSVIELSSKLESKSYVDMTIKILKDFGVEIIEGIKEIEDEVIYDSVTNVQTIIYKGEKAETYSIKGNQNYISPKEIIVEGDWSNSSYFLILKALEAEIELSGLDKNSTQGDKRVLQLLYMLTNKRNNMLGLHFENGEGPRNEYDFVETFFNVEDTPDLVPGLAVMAALTKGKTKLVNCKRLRLKESDRVESTLAMIKALGGDIYADQNNIHINGKNLLNGGEVQSYGDHRIVMAAAIASYKCKNPIKIIGAESVNKSFPNFFYEMEKIGFEINIE